MEQKLSHTQAVSVLLAVLFVHIGILFSIIIIRFDTLPPEATIILASEQDNPTEHSKKSTRDWVTIHQAIVPHAAQKQSVPSKPQDDPPQESTPTTQEPSIDHAVAIAKKVLGRVTKESPLCAAPSRHISPAKTPSPVNQSLTLAQLTQGFMQQLQTSSMTVQGNRQGNASMEQLQQMHYLQKILACLVATYKILTNSTFKNSPMEQARIYLAIKRDGSIHALHLAQSSGNVAVDQFLINLFQEASSSFPPLPASFKQDVLDVPLFTVEHLESFHSVNEWYIDNTIP